MKAFAFAFVFVFVCVKHWRKPQQLSKSVVEALYCYLVCFLGVQVAFLGMLWCVQDRYFKLVVCLLLLFIIMCFNSVVWTSEHWCVGDNGMLLNMLDLISNSFNIQWEKYLLCECDIHSYDSFYLLLLSFMIEWVACIIFTHYTCILCISTPQFKRIYNTVISLL